jgi:NAD(P)-dependent dehydrogenase (short-subunit alcohol dehydrogenase family)
MNATPQRVMVTAAGAGIGRRIAERFAEQGARVHASDVDKSAIESAFSDNQAVKGAHVDVTDEVQVNAWFDEALEDLGGVDVMVNCAGIAGPTAPVDEMDFQEWKRCLDVNLDGQFLCSKRAIPPLKAQGSGLIVNFSSTAGLFGFARRAPYCTAKWGVIGFTKTLAVELGPHGVRCNCICPGPVEGDRMDRVIAAEAAKTGRSEDEVRAQVTDHVALGKFVTADDMADMVLFLASPSGSMVNGQALPVDGYTQGL